MKKKKKVFIVGTLLMACVIGLLWFNRGITVNSVSAIKYNAWNTHNE